MPSSKKTTWYFQCKKEDYTKLNINLRVYSKYDIIEKNKRGLGIMKEEKSEKENIEDNRNDDSSMCVNNHSGLWNNG